MRFYDLLGLCWAMVPVVASSSLPCVAQREIVTGFAIRTNIGGGLDIQDPGFHWQTIPDWPFSAEDCFRLCCTDKLFDSWCEAIWFYYYLPAAAPYSDPDPIPRCTLMSALKPHLLTPIANHSYPLLTSEIWKKQLKYGLTENAPIMRSTTPWTTSGQVTTAAADRETTPKTSTIQQMYPQIRVKMHDAEKLETESYIENSTSRSDESAILSRSTTQEPQIRVNIHDAEKLETESYIENSTSRSDESAVLSRGTTQEPQIRVNIHDAEKLETESYRADSPGSDDGTTMIPYTTNPATADYNTTTMLLQNSSVSWYDSFNHSTIVLTIFDCIIVFVVAVSLVSTSVRKSGRKGD